MPQHPPPAMEPILPRIASELGVSLWVFVMGVGTVLWNQAHLFFRVKQLESANSEQKILLHAMDDKLTKIFERLIKIETLDQANHRHEKEQR